MRPYFLVVLLFLLGCSTTPTNSLGRTFQQATAYRPPPAAPAPSGAPVPAYPGVYVPNGGTPGVGAPMVGQPGQQGTQVQRSPNKRILPPTKEPGLWAADGAPSASSDLPAVPSIAGVELPFPPGSTSDWDKTLTRICAHDMQRIIYEVMNITKWNPMALPLDVRRCIAARLYEHCASGHRSEHEEKIRSGKAAKVNEDVLLSMTVMVKSTDRTAKEFVRKACAGVPKNQEVEERVTHAMIGWNKGREEDQ